jgi:hypothetical protein
MCALQFVFYDVYDQEWEQPSYVRFISQSNSSAIASIWRPETGRLITTWLRYYFLTFHHALLSTQFYRKSSWPLPYTRYSCISRTGSEGSPPPDLQCADTYFSKDYICDVFYTYVFIYLWYVVLKLTGSYHCLPISYGNGTCLIYFDKYHRRLCIHSRRQIIMYMYIRVCVYGLTYVRMYVFAHACMHVCKYVYVRTYASIYISMCVCVCVCVGARARV